MGQKINANQISFEMHSI